MPFNPLRQSIQIGGHTITTEYDSALQMDCKTIGQFVPRTNTIKIYPDMPDIQKTQTWLHELNEAVNVIFCCEKLEHDHIEQLAQAYLQILPQTGWEIAWT